MENRSEPKLWEPEDSATLNGMFHLEGGLNWTVTTEDGAIWLLEADAENQLEALDPEEGHAVQVLYEQVSQGRPTYRITLL